MEGQLIAPLLPAAKSKPTQGMKRSANLRDIIHAIRYRVAVLGPYCHMTFLGNQKSIEVGVCFKNSIKSSGLKMVLGSAGCRSNGGYFR